MFFLLFKNTKCNIYHNNSNNNKIKVELMLDCTKKQMITNLLNLANLQMLIKD